MRPRNIHLAFTGILVIGTVILYGCDSHYVEVSNRFCEHLHNISLGLEQWELQVESNPCGWLRIRPPLVNVTGFLTESLYNDTDIFLFVTPNTSFNASMYVVEHCHPIQHNKILGNDRFHFGPLPSGNYVVMFERQSLDPVQGFPIIHETNESGIEVKMAFQGGNARYSIAAFTI